MFLLWKSDIIPFIFRFACLLRGTLFSVQYYIHMYLYMQALTHSHLYIYKYMYIITLWQLEIFFLSLLILLQIFSPSRKPNVSSDYVFVISSLNLTGDQWFFPKKKNSDSDFWFPIFDFPFSMFFFTFLIPSFCRYEKKKNEDDYGGPMSTTATYGSLFRYSYSESEASIIRGPHQVGPPMVWTAQITCLFFA